MEPGSARATRLLAVIAAVLVGVIATAGLAARLTTPSLVRVNRNGGVLSGTWTGTEDAEPAVVAVGVVEGRNPSGSCSASPSPFTTISRRPA